MSFAQFFNKKQLLATIFLACIMLLIPSRLSAQQRTEPAVPETRNPQSNAPQLFQQRNDVQPTTPQQLLNQPLRIEIPEGIPVEDRDDTIAPTQQGRRLVLLLVGILAVVAFIILIKRNQKPVNPMQANLTAPVDVPVERVVPSVGLPQKKHKSSKKKKSKGKPRKKH